MDIETTAIQKRTQVFYLPYASFPTDGLFAGDLAYATDQKILYRWSGTSWDAITRGPFPTELAAYANLILPVPTVTGWTETLVGTGTTALTLTRMSVTTGVNANSSGLRYAACEGLDLTGTNYVGVNWAKKLTWIFNMLRNGSDAQVIGRIQLKHANAIGALADMGIGIRADNLALVGESYGTVLGEVDLATALTELCHYQVMIVLDPSVPSIAWYVNGVLKGTQVTANKIPSGSNTTAAYLVHSIANGAAGGTNCAQYLSQPKILQER